MLCGILDGWGGGRGPQEGGDICVLTADSLHCTAETTIVKSLYANLKLTDFKNYENYGQLDQQRVSGDPRLPP